MSKKRKLFTGLFFILLALVALMVMEWKSWLEAKIRTELSAKGLNQLAFSLDHVSITGITFKDVSLPGDMPLNVDSITIDYSPFELLHGQLRQLVIPELTFKKDQTNVTLHNIMVNFIETMAGDWSIGNIEASKGDFPSISAMGKWSASDEQAQVQGELKSADAAYRASFAMDYMRQAPQHSKLTITNVKLPWNGGKVSARNVVIMLSGGHNIVIPLTLENVSLDALLQGVTNNRAKATGRISGMVPVIIQADGRISVGEGNLKTQEAGTVALSPDVIPGDNAQVAMVREILKNFHYTDFSMALRNSKDKQLSILLSLAGNNPDAYNGQQVKLNVQLSGDLLNLMQQSILPMADPKNLLKDNYGKP